MFVDVYMIFMFQVIYVQCVVFVFEIVGCLYSYGIMVQCLEMVVVVLVCQFDLDCELWLNFIGIIFSFSDLVQVIGFSDIICVICLVLGENDLYKFSVVDYIVEEVFNGWMSIVQGYIVLCQLDKDLGWCGKLCIILLFIFGVVGVVGMWKLLWLDIVIVGVIGLMIGLFGMVIDCCLVICEVVEVLVVLLVGMVVILVVFFIGVFNFNMVIIVLLVVLLFGMLLINVVNELVSQYWVLGIVCFVGVLIIIMKFSVGVMIVVILVDVFGLDLVIWVVWLQGLWVEWGLLLIVVFVFVMLFKVNCCDYLWVIVVLVVGYVIFKFGGYVWGVLVGIFLLVMLLIVGGNLFGCLVGCLGVIICLLGIIMMVFGSISLCGVLILVQQQDVGVGQSVFFIVFNVVMVLVVGLLFGNLLMLVCKILQS